MSALGQKQTYAAQQGMSALPPKADKIERLKFPILLSDQSIIALGANQQQDYPESTGVPPRLER
jgi:hypothetical protein